MIKVAVTGGLCCGKSTVCGVFASLGAHVMSADAIVHELLMPNTSTSIAVIALLGDNILDAKGHIDRRLVAQEVFTNRSKLKALEAILHPAVRIEIQKTYSEIAENHNIPLFVVEIPLLFEGDSAREYDVTIAVIADEAQCQKRYKEKHPDRDDYTHRSKQQLPQQEKAEQADYIIDNNGNFDELEKSVKVLFDKLLITRNNS